MIPKAMVLEKRMLDLLSLLESHVGGATPKIPIVPKPPTPAPPPPSQIKTADKKWKRNKREARDPSRKKRSMNRLLLNKARPPK